jgi:DNA-binding CsgD family transcriptional regulator
VINLLLCKHDQQIGENTFLIRKQKSGLEQLLEVRVTSSPEVAFSPPKRPNSTTIPDQSVDHETESFDISKFSTQERKILSVFFEHADMYLSYKDISRMLQKSPNTIKNQMHQIKIKANLFDRSVDSDQRSRFKLKKTIKIEKYLTNRADQSA